MIKIVETDCGVRLVMERIPHVQSVSVGLWVRAGSVHEEKRTGGISHVVEHMLFKGTETKSAKQIAEEVDSIGSHMNAFTGKESTCYYIKSLASNIEQSTDILLDMFLNSVFEPKELRKEKRVIREEIKMIEDSPEDDIYEQIGALVFKGMPLERSVIGTSGSLRHISQCEIKNYVESQYTKDSIVVSVAGNFEEDQIRNIIEGKLAGLRPSKEWDGMEGLPHTPKRKIKEKDIEQAHICLGTRGVKLGDDRYYAFAILNNILGGGMSARLFQNIREQKGLAYAVYSSSNSFTETGIFSIYAAVAHDKVQEALAAIREELEALRKKGITADELKASQEQLKAQYIFSQESVNGRMFSIGKHLTLLGKVMHPEEVIARIDAVDLACLEEVSKLVDDIKTYSGVLITNGRPGSKTWAVCS